MKTIYYLWGQNQEFSLKNLDQKSKCLVKRPSLKVWIGPKSDIRRLM